MQRNRILPSPSRCYVAVCLDFRHDPEGRAESCDVTTRHYFRKFSLPTHGQTEGYEENFGAGDWVEGSYTPVYSNTAALASWYFLNILNLMACIDKCISLEEFQDLTDQDQINEESKAARAAMHSSRAA